MNDKHRPVIAYLALGSNLGDRLANIRGARRALHRPPEISVVAASAIYETEPVGGPEEQPAYLNAVLRVETPLAAAELLAASLAVEKLYGRRRLERWGPRSLDVDVLLFGDQIHNQRDLIIPHPRLPQRAFVLMPLLEIADDLTHPTLGMSLREMLSQLPSTAGVRRLPDSW